MKAEEEAMAKQVAANQALNEGQAMQQMEKQKQAHEQQKLEEEKRQQIMRQLLDTGAQERLARIGIVKPEKKKMLEQLLIGMVQKGQIQTKLDENQLIQLLENFEGEKSGSIKIQRKRAADDSDDDIVLDDC